MSTGRRATSLRPLTAAALLILAAALPATAAPTRVATLLPWVAGALDRIPQGVDVVAAVRPTLRSTLPPGRADLGSPHAPSFEVLASARPDLVIADGRFHTAITGDLERLAPRLVLLQASSVESTLDGLREVGSAAGVEAAMEALVTDAEESLDDLRLARAVRVLPLFGAPGSLMAITGSTWLGDLLERVGFVNLAATAEGRESFPGYVELSDELLATLDPELVLLVTHGSPDAVLAAFEAEAQRGGPWGRLVSRIRVLDPELFGRNPGLELPAAGSALVKLGDGAPAASAQSAR